MCVLEGDLVGDLLVFRLDEGVVLVAMGVEVRKNLESFGATSVVNEPSWRFGEEQDQKSKEPSWNELNTERYTPRLVTGRIVDECSIRTLEES